MRHARSDSAWSLGAVLAERAVDERTHLLVIRPDVGVPAALALRRRLLGLHLAGYATLVVEIVGRERVAGAVLAVLLQTRRKLEQREGRLVLAADSPEVRHALAQAGLEVTEL